MTITNCHSAMDRRLLANCKRLADPEQFTLKQGSTLNLSGLGQKILHRAR